MTNLGWHCDRCSLKKGAMLAWKACSSRMWVAPAALAGVQAGDVLMAVNGTPVKTVDQVRAVVAKSNKSVALLIQRDRNKIFVPVRVG